MKLGRNDPCHCGSGKKYKACHLAADEATARKKASEAAALSPVPEPAAESEAKASSQKAHAPRHQTQQPWKGGGKATTRGFARVSATRKVGGGG
jgi:hypothetical protein